MKLAVIPNHTSERTYWATLAVYFEGPDAIGASFGITEKDIHSNIIPTPVGGGVSLTKLELTAIPALNTFLKQIAPALQEKIEQISTHP